MATVGIQYSCEKEHVIILFRWYTYMTLCQVKCLVCTLMCRQLAKFWNRVTEKMQIWLVWKQMAFLFLSLFHSFRGQMSAWQPENQRWESFTCSSLNLLNRLCYGDLCNLYHKKPLIFAVRGFERMLWEIIGTALTSCSDKTGNEHSSTSEAIYSNFRHEWKKVN